MRFLSLDKWLKPEKKKDKPERDSDIKPKSEAKENLEPKSTQKTKEESTKEQIKSSTVQKFILSCPKKSCNFQKIKVLSTNRDLPEKDKICPKCKGELKIKNP